MGRSAMANDSDSGPNCTVDGDRGVTNSVWLV